MAGEGERGERKEGAVLQGPSGEGGDEPGVLKRVIGIRVTRRRRWRRKVGGGEQKRGVLGSEVEHVVGLGLPFLDDPTA